MECNVLLPATGLLNAAENYNMYCRFITYGLFILFSVLTGYVNGPVFNKEVRKKTNRHFWPRHSRLSKTIDLSFTLLSFIFIFNHDRGVRMQTFAIAVAATGNCSSPKIWKACGNFGKNRRQPAHEMFVQSDVTESLEVERATIILMKKPPFLPSCIIWRKAADDGRNPSWKAMRVPREPTLPVNHKCVVLFGRVEKKE